MGKFASSTKVSPEKTRAEIERTITRYGADAFGYGTEPGRAVVQFRAHGKHIRFVLELPSIGAEEFRYVQVNQVAQRPRSESGQRQAWEQACAQRWRALLLMVKAKLEAVESGITTFEEEFLAHIVLPDGRTVGQAMIPAIEQACLTGKLPNVSFLALPAPKDDGPVIPTVED